MNASRNRSMAGVILIALAAVLYGCQQPRHQHPEDRVGAPRQFTCQTCYDEAVRVRTGPPKHRRYKTIYKHRCTSCRADMEVYHADGKSMFKCGSCAPGGLPCEECLPPKALGD